MPRGGSCASPLPIAGDEEELAEALVELARRLLVIRPFTPDKANALSPDWETILKDWVTGVGVSEIGPDHMRVVEDAFSYRLVWALEALRSRRLTLGWSPDIIPGGAACLETGSHENLFTVTKTRRKTVRLRALAFLRGEPCRLWLSSDGEESGNWRRDGSNSGRRTFVERRWTMFAFPFPLVILAQFAYVFLELRNDFSERRTNAALNVVGLARCMQSSGG